MVRPSRRREMRRPAAKPGLESKLNLNILPGTNRRSDSPAEQYAHRGSSARPAAEAAPAALTTDSDRGGHFVRAAGGIPESGGVSFTFWPDVSKFQVTYF